MEVPDAVAFKRVFFEWEMENMDLGLGSFGHGI